MDLNDLLRAKQIDPHEVIVFRHRPWEIELRRWLPLLAADKPQVFNAYQQNHNNKNVETALRASRYLASFIGQEPGRATFVGLYKVGRSKKISLNQYWKIPANIELKKLGMSGMDRASFLLFDLVVEPEFYSTWKGKLIVNWPPPERSWWRRAHRNKMTIHAILEDSALDAVIKRWDELDLTWDQLGRLPKRLQIALEQWRGIYYIFDVSDRKGYVGSAYGLENLFGRWRNYSSTGHGGNRLLRKRDSRNFRFSILELVAPTLNREEVIALEALWKVRLHTRHPYGLNDN